MVTIFNLHSLPHSLYSICTHIFLIIKVQVKKKKRILAVRE